MERENTVVVVVVVGKASSPVLLLGGQSMQGGGKSRLGVVVQFLCLSEIYHRSNATQVYFALTKPACLRKQNKTHWGSQLLVSLS